MGLGSTRLVRQFEWSQLGRVLVMPPSPKWLPPVQPDYHQTAEHMVKWFSKNDLIVNTDKTCAISFHPYQNHQPTKPLIKLKNNIIGYKTELKFLGLNVTETVYNNIHFIICYIRFISTYFLPVLYLTAHNGACCRSNEHE
jgi:hypothetical protein